MMDYCKECKLKRPDGRSMFTGETNGRFCGLGFHAPRSEEATINLVRQNGYGFICSQNPYRDKIRDLFVPFITSRGMRKLAAEKETT